MKLKYSFAKNKVPNKTTLKTCDEGCKGMKNLIIETGRISFGIFGLMLCWILTRFVKRTITNKYIEYDFFLIR